jgi:hypothetical protein
VSGISTSLILQSHHSPLSGSFDGTEAEVFISASGRKAKLMPGL